MSELRDWGGIIRKLWSPERDKLRDHLLRLDGESRRYRFGHGVSDAFIKDYAARITDHNSIVYGYFTDTDMRAAAELRKLSDTWSPEAEAAFSVEPDFQGKGIGSELMGRIIRVARNRGVQRLYITCLAENTRMQRIARKHQALLRFERGDIMGEIVPKAPSPASVLDEVMDDQRGYVLTVLDLHSRWLPAVA